MPSGIEGVITQKDLNYENHTDRRITLFCYICKDAR